MHLTAEIDESHPASGRDVHTRRTTPAGADTSRIAPQRTTKELRHRQQTDRAPQTDQASIVHTCREQITRLLEIPPGADEDTFARLEELRLATNTWSRQGISFETIQQAASTAADQIFDRLIHGVPRTEAQQLVRSTRRLLQIRDAITSTISAAYVAQLQHTVDTAPHTPLRTVASTLTVVETGLPQEKSVTAELYVVVAIAIPGTRPGHPGDRTRAQFAQQQLQRIRSALAEHSGRFAVTVLGTRGGTILLPASQVTDDSLDELVSSLTEAGRVSIAAAALYATPNRIQYAADYAHELLDTAQRLQYPAGLYKYPDLAVEHQLTRPGPARDKLRSILDPLHKYPDLLQTLLILIHTNSSKRDTARSLKLHRNTVDYRLRRIQELTGYDPARPSGLWYLRAALVVHAYCSRHENTVPIGSAAGLE